MIWICWCLERWDVIHYRLAIVPIYHNSYYENFDLTAQTDGTL